tara:strand:- start:3445 stop:3882 length:438 start_codon:yes stop_codon:yes gene_type:complete
MRLSGERKIQLEEIAQLTGAGSLSAAIGELIKLARTQGMVDHSIPGVTINSFDDGLAIAFDDASPTGFSHDGVEALAATIRDYVQGTAEGGVCCNMDHDYSVSRRGSSFKVAIPMNSANPKTWAADIALEFADLIEAECEKAKNA